ncbi:MAG: hypothetical protein IKB88_00115 [Clostridia bacterium]|nr:hypothetical protein [Clostridia bacterium]
MFENNEQSTGRKMSEYEKQSVIEKLWLIYFNDTLYEKGLITETERNRMANKIHAHKPSGQSR